MTSLPDSGPSTSSRLRAAWGLPDLAGQGRFVVANLVDSLGNGLVLAFTLVFFVRTTTLPIVEIGAALTIGQLVALPAPALVGRLLDAYGARLVVAAGNGMSVVGFVGFLLVDTPVGIAVAQVVVQVGATAYWMGSGPLTAMVASRADRTRWFGFVRALRNVGVGVGGAASAVALGIGTVTALQAVIVVNAVTFAAAGWIILTLRPPDRTATDADAGPAERAPTVRPAGGYGTVLTDLRYLRLVVANLAFVFASTVISVLFTVYAVDALGVGAWVVGAVVVLNAVVVALFQTLASRWTEGRRPATVLVLALVVNAIAFVLLGALLVLPRWAVLAGLLLATVLYTVGEILSSPLTNELSVTMAPEHLRGRYLGVYQLSWSLGTAVAPGVMTALLTGGAAWPWVFLTALSVLAVPFVTGLDRPVTR